MTHQRGSSAIAVILIILLLLALGAGVFVIYKQKQGEKLPQFTTFDHIDLNKDVVVFLFQSVPLLYNRTAQLNNELSLITGELQRLDKLESQYPSENKIIEEERKLWLQLQKKLELSVQSLKSAADAYYVAYSVNPRKGKEMIRENIGDLVSDIDSVLKESNTETRRLKTASSQSLVDRLKDLF